MKFLTDENFEGAFFRGLLRHRPGIDLVRVQDVGLAEADDLTILEWASQEGELFSHMIAARCHDLPISA